MAMKTSVQIDRELQNAREVRYQTWKALEESPYNSINNPYQEKLYRLTEKVKKLEREYQIASAMESAIFVLKQTNERYGKQKAIDVFNNSFRKSIRFTNKRKEEIGLAVFGDKGALL